MAKHEVHQAVKGVLLCLHVLQKERSHEIEALAVADALIKVSISIQNVKKWVFAWGFWKGEGVVARLSSFQIFLDVISQLLRSLIPEKLVEL